MDDSSELSSLSSAPSSPLSELSNSPSPPPDDRTGFRSSSRDAFGAYPSPPASQKTSQSGSPGPDNLDSSTIAVDSSGQRPAKRRRISKDTPKERTTETLYLGGDKIDPEQRPQLDRLLNVLHKKQKIVVIAGAGISVSAGIPDFRSASGLFKSLKDDYKLKGSGKDLFDASVYKDDSSTSSFHDMVSKMSHMIKDAKPTPFHHMLATIAQEDRLLRLYSQNVDGIDTSLPPLHTSVPLQKNEKGKWPKTVQLHGGLAKMVCTKCRDLTDLNADLFEGPIPPSCSSCVEINNIRTQHEGKRSHGIGRLRPRMVLYNEHNPDDEAIGAVTQSDLRKRPDAVIVVGTTLKVPGVRRIVREMCGVVRDRRGGVTIWINNDPPPVSKDLEDCWDIIVQGKCDDVADRAAMRRWDQPALTDDFADITDEQAQTAVINSLHPALPPSLPHVKRESLPSAAHRNNSFRPPPHGITTPRKNLESPPTPSPITNHRFTSTVRNDIEGSFVNDSENSFAEDDEEPTAYPTPSKTRDGGKTHKQILQFGKPAVPAAKGTAKQKLLKLGRPSASAKNTKATKPAPIKRANVKYVKPPASAKSRTTSKSKAPTKPTQAASLTKSFKQSKRVAHSPLTSAKKDIINKSAADDVAAVAADLVTLPAAPAPLQPRAIVELPMHPVSPQDLRNNFASPPAKEMDKISTGSAEKMRIASLVN